jgi:hypothetical protein
MNCDRNIIEWMVINVEKIVIRLECFIIGSIVSELN